jgi:hypothetical protein
MLERSGSIAEDLDIGLAAILPYADVGVAELMPPAALAMG